MINSQEKKIDKMLEAYKPMDQLRIYEKVRSYLLNQDLTPDEYTDLHKYLINSLIRKGKHARNK